MTLFDYALTACYYLVFVVMILKSIRYYLEYRKTERRFKLIGILSSLSLATGMATIIVNATYPPGETPYVLRTLVRLSFMAFAVLSFVLELMTMKTLVVLTGPAGKLKRTFLKL